MKSINRHHDCKNELHLAALRATPARIAVMQLLEKAQAPLDATTITRYLQKQDIPTDPATVFRILNMFTQKGITMPIQFQEGKTRYELSNKQDHHHLICDTCGRIEDIQDTIIPRLEKQIQKNYSFSVKRHSLEFFGLCAQCQK